MTLKGVCNDEENVPSDDRYGNPGRIFRIGRRRTGMVRLCQLCHGPMGRYIEWYRDTVWYHSVCHPGRKSWSRLLGLRGPGTVYSKREYIWWRILSPASD